MARRRGGGRAAIGARAHLAVAERPAGFEHRLSLRLSKQCQLHPRLCPPVRHDADRYSPSRQGARRIGRGGIFVLTGGHIFAPLRGGPLAKVDRKGVVSGKGGAVRENVGGGRTNKKK